MPLKIALKPNETVILGGAIVRNAGKGTALVIENKVPILRGKDILQENNAITPTQQAYYAIQRMYTDPINMGKYSDVYDQVCDVILKSAPDSMPYLCKASLLIESGDLYNALKIFRSMMQHKNEKVILGIPDLRPSVRQRA